MSSIIVGFRDGKMLEIDTIYDTRYVIVIDGNIFQYEFLTFDVAKRVAQSVVMYGYQMLDIWENMKSMY